MSFLEFCLWFDLSGLAYEDVEFWICRSLMYLTITSKMVGNDSGSSSNECNIKVSEHNSTGYKQRYQIYCKFYEPFSKWSWCVREAHWAEFGIATATVAARLIWFSVLQLKNSQWSECVKSYRFISIRSFYTWNSCITSHKKIRVNRNVLLPECEFQHFYDFEPCWGMP